ncbi:MAG: hypothetical protein HS132_09880 [Planctomycetia bacterium]|nr:hypothetical protein [Planctomycetia bacterium]
MELHEAWQKTLDIKELNKGFMKNFSIGIYGPSRKLNFHQIRPKEDLIPDEAHQSESVIRLLTRLLFCWFMKEKQELIPEFLFDKKEVAKILIDFSPENEKSSVFYRAILQNLFLLLWVFSKLVCKSLYNFNESTVRHEIHKLFF